MPNNLSNILLIEDNPGDTRLVQELLLSKKEQEINLLVATTLQEGLKLIATELIHVILLDLNLPDSQSIDTFTKVNKFALDVPVIITSGISDKELVFEALKLGAQDYFIKGQTDEATLLRAIRYAMWCHFHPA